MDRNNKKAFHTIKQTDRVFYFEFKSKKNIFLSFSFAIKSPAVFVFLYHSSDSFCFLETEYTRAIGSNGYAKSKSFKLSSSVIFNTSLAYDNASSDCPNIAYIRDISHCPLYSFTTSYLSDCLQ